MGVEITGLILIYNMAVRPPIYADTVATYVLDGNFYDTQGGQGTRDASIKGF